MIFRKWKHAVDHRMQRARRGYSYRDVWSFDTFICGVIADACRDIRLKGHGFGNGYTPESWAQYLLDIEEPLRDWSKNAFDCSDYEINKARYEAAQAAMHRFADELGQMWD